MLFTFITTNALSYLHHLFVFVHQRIPIGHSKILPNQPDLFHNSEGHC